MTSQPHEMSSTRNSQHTEGTTIENENRDLQNIIQTCVTKTTSIIIDNITHRIEQQNKRKLEELENKNVELTNKVAKLSQENVAIMKKFKALIKQDAVIHKLGETITTWINERDYGTYFDDEDKSGNLSDLAEASEELSYSSDSNDGEETDTERLEDDDNYVEEESSMTLPLNELLSKESNGSQSRESIGGNVNKKTFYTNITMKVLKLPYFVSRDIQFDDLHADHFSYSTLRRRFIACGLQPNTNTLKQTLRWFNYYYDQLQHKEAS